LENTGFVKDSHKVLQDDLDHLVDDFKSRFNKLTSISYTQDHDIKIGKNVLKNNYDIEYENSDDQIDNNHFN